MKKKIYNEQLCPICKVGMDSYILDNKSPFCPYLHLHTGDSCAKFVEMNESEVNANDRV